MARPLFCLLPLVLLAPLAVPAQAQDCSNPTQMGLDECVSAAYDKTDKKLNAVYGKIVTRIGKDAETKADLVKAQKAWIAFRDAECDFRASSVQGGTIYPTAVLVCLDTVTKARVADLEGLLSCQEGDITCPVPPAN